MHNAKCSIMLLLVLLLLAGCSSGSPAISSAESPDATPVIDPVNTEASTDNLSEENQKFKFNLKISAPSLSANMLDEPAENSIYVVLPISYYETDKSYPVIYFLHGHGNDYKCPANIIDTNKMSEICEFILVGINGTNSLGGSFYTDSPVIGNWEDFVVNDVVNYVDENYRTIADASSRGLFGFSMGGSGAINIGLSHPDTFSAVYATCPGLFDESGLQNAMSTWGTTFRKSYGAAFSPDVNAEPFYTIPQFDSSEEDNIIVNNWEDGFGNLKNKVASYLAKDCKLAGLEIEYGKNDAYTWIPQGCVYFSQLLIDNNVDHKLIETTGNHSIDLEMLYSEMLPFFAEKLKS